MCHLHFQPKWTHCSAAQSQGEITLGLKICEFLDHKHFALIFDSLYVCLAVAVLISVSVCPIRMEAKSKKPFSPKGGKKFTQKGKGEL